ncbi:MAG TPA: PVC-type heme-binding CxxCH protein [Pirellulales bacterium]|nr:PVC-type heme-binding CxxCH protein [Pirellulales bacterium]
MSALLHVSLLLTVLGADPANPAVTPTPPPPGTHVVTLPRHNFTLPVGFEVMVAAGAPLIERPIHADFDEQGRLYVCESSGTNDKVEKQLAEKPHWVMRLEDTDGDGTFDRATKFADKLMFPEGMMWLDGSIYVAAPPSIWKLTDTDNDGVADQREEWFAGKTLGGCANDLHGPYEGIDGWIYWAKGGFGQQTYDRPGKEPFVTRAAHLFRSRPDNSGIEPVMTGGMDNPVEIAFTLGGERIFDTTFFQHPGGGQRDGLIHAIYGGVYGKEHNVIDGHPRTGDLMPPMTHFGAAAPAGLMRYESRTFGNDFANNLFAAQFNMHKVSRHVMVPAGATFQTRDHDFLVSDNLDFHPTDVLEDADGSLVVIDTGGWYKLCCPSSQLWKPEIAGGIYRVRRAGAKAVADPRGLKLAWSDATPDALAERLADARPAVRRRALHELARRGKGAVPAVAQVRATSRDVGARARAVWTLARIEGDDARAAIRAALADSDETVRQAAIHATSVARDRTAVPHLIKILRSGTPQNRRAAAEALGRLDDRKAVPALLQTAGEELDRTLEHSVIYALIELAAPKETADGLASANPGTRRAALLAMDQMSGGGLQPEVVAALVAGPDASVRDAAASLLLRHGEWAVALAPWLARELATGALTGDKAELMGRLLAHFSGEESVQQLMAARLAEKSVTDTERRGLLQAMSQAGLKHLPASWVAPVTRVLESGDAVLLPLAVAVVRAMPAGESQAADVRAALVAAAANEQLSEGVRLDALAATPGGLGNVQPTLFDFVRKNLAADAQVSVRLAAADVLSKAQLDDAQLLALADSVRTAGPLEIERLVAPFAKSKNDKVGRTVIAALASSQALPNVRAETLQEVFKDYEPAVQQETKTLYDLLAASTAERMAKIEELLTLLPHGDIKRGQLVFNSQKAACATCHAIGYLGGTVGPDLTHVGKIRSERDLLEAIVFPSASFVRSYEPMTITTHGGQVHNGIVRKDAPDEVILVLNAKDTVRVGREEIDEMIPGSTSIMPAGLDKQLTADELIDLVTFLRAAK